MWTGRSEIAIADFSERDLLLAQIKELEKKLARQRLHVQKLVEAIQANKKKHGAARDALGVEIRAMRHALQQYVPGDEPTIVRVGDLWIPSRDPKWYGQPDPTGKVIWLEKPPKEIEPRP